MTATELLSGLRPITTHCIDTFAPFYDERAKHYVYPRFMQSVCALIDMGNTFFKIIRANTGDVLLVLKRTRIFGKLGVQMPFCPISLSGSVSDEREIIQTALRFGISLRVTTEDISRYKIPMKLCSDGTGPFVPVNNEYIYDALRGSEMNGSKYRKQRYQVKKIVNLKGFFLTREADPQADRLVRDWDERYKRINGSQTDQTHLWQIIQQAVSSSDRVAITNLFVGDTLQGVSVVERLSQKHFVIVFRIRNYNSPLNDVGSAMQYLDCHFSLPASRSEGCYLNMGLADSEGLIKSKESLNPCRHQKIYTVKTTKTNSSLLTQYFK